MAPSDQPPTADAHDPAAAISRLVQDTTAAYTDQRPTGVETHVSRDTVLVVLRGALSNGEQTLIDAGRSEHVLATRRAYQHVMRADFIDGIQTILGRHVKGFFSDHQFEPDDVSVEVFLLDAD